MKVISRQPLLEKSSELWTPDGIAQVKPFQIVVMVSLSIDDTLEPGARRFPAILDAGLNHNFAIRREHLDRWTGLRPPYRKPITIQKTEIPLAAAQVWVYRNQQVRTRPRISLRSASGRRRGSRSSRRTCPTRLGCRSLAFALSCGAA